MRSQKLSDLMFGNSPKAFRIKDYSQVDRIFKLYLKNHFDGMSKDIFFYKASEFVVDLILYLQMHFKGTNIRRFMFEDIMDEYHMREPLIKAELDFKKERKKYGL